jgi:hypothetical protein
VPAPFRKKWGSPCLKRLVDCIGGLIAPFGDPMQGPALCDDKAGGFDVGETWAALEGIYVARHQAKLAAKCGLLTKRITTKPSGQASFRA